MLSISVIKRTVFYQLKQSMPTTTTKQTHTQKKTHRKYKQYFDCIWCIGWSNFELWQKVKLRHGHYERQFLCCKTPYPYGDDSGVNSSHLDDVITMKVFLYYWPCVARSSDEFFDVSLNKLLSKQSVIRNVIELCVTSFAEFRLETGICVTSL